MTVVERNPLIAIFRSCTVLPSLMAHIAGLSDAFPNKKYKLWLWTSGLVDAS